MLMQAKEVDSEISIEMTPMIDMVFLLLIFFLVATTFQQTEREMQIALPIASSSAPISALLQELVINVTAEGEIIVGGRTMDGESLSGMITSAVANNPEQKVTIRGDKGTPYANIIGVLDICKTAGIQEPYLDTVPTN